MIRSKSRNRFTADNCLRLTTALVLIWTTAGYPAFAQTPPPQDQQQTPPPQDQQAPPPQGQTASPPPEQAAAPADQSAQGYSMSDLEYILGPIALYPDPLLALIFPASNFPDQLAQAKQWIDANPQAIANNDFSAVDSMPWDPTVQALTRFPDVIDMLTEKPDWTESVAWAFSVQHEDVSAAIQLLRAQAKNVGNLQSTPQQVVTTQPSSSGGPPVIYIAPTDPERIYVPVYDPGVVFGGAVAGALFFSTAVFVGATWNNRWGWNNRTWNQVWITPPMGWRPMPGRPGGRPVWRPDNRPVWRPDRPALRPERPNFRPDRPGFRPDRPGGGARPDRPGGRPDRPNFGPGGRPGARPELPPSLPDRPNMRPDRPGAGNRPGGGNRPNRPDFGPGGGRPDRPNINRPNVRPENRPQRPNAGNRPNVQRPQNRPQINRPQGRPQQARPQMRPQQRHQARPQARPSRPHGGGGGRERRSR